MKAHVGFQSGSLFLECSALCRRPLMSSSAVSSSASLAKGVIRTVRRAIVAIEEAAVLSP